MSPTKCADVMDYVLDESPREADGVGPIIDVSNYKCGLLVVTLNIGKTIERESLSVSIWGSEDQMDWGVKPLACFSEKSYCGMYSTLLNLESHPKIRYLRVEWRMRRWAKVDPAPLFEFSVFLQPSGSRMKAAHA